MLEENLFARADVVPSWFANAIQKFLSVGAFNFRVVASDPTHVQVQAGVGDQAAAIAIDGLWRWTETTVGPVAMPGGVSGAYPVFVTCKNNSIVSTPLPFTDATDRSFGLQVKSPGGTPTIVPGTVDQYRHVADVLWDSGLQITGVRQLVPPAPLHGPDHAAGGIDPIQLLVPSDVGTGSGAPSTDRQVVVGTFGSLVTLTSAVPGRLVVVYGSGVGGAGPLEVFTGVGDVIIGRGLPSGGVSSVQFGSDGGGAWFFCDTAGQWKLIAGEADSGWQPITRGANVSFSGGYQPEVRTRGDMVDMCGDLLTTAAGVTALGTVPSFAIPDSNVQLGPFLTFGLVTIAVTSGAITCATAVASGSKLGLDGLSYRLRN